MYIDILLGLVFFASLYLLWRSIMRKIPELAAIPDKEISVLLEENTAKLHWFILHVFHFRIFYRERHYQDKFWNFCAKIIFKIHILFLRLDNGLMSILKRIRTNREGVEPGNIPGDYIKQLSLPSANYGGGEEVRLPDERKNPIQEVRQRKRIHGVGTGWVEPKVLHREISQAIVNIHNELSTPKQEAGIGSIHPRRSMLPRRVKRNTNQSGADAFAKPDEIRTVSLDGKPRTRMHGDERKTEEESEVDLQA